MRCTPRKPRVARSRMQARNYPVRIDQRRPYGAEVGHIASTLKICQVSADNQLSNGRKRHLRSSFVLLASDKANAQIVLHRRPSCIPVSPASKRATLL
ncbi:hypothetical protein PSAB6_230153 [Paraburkholderia sabiae]|nr:hypothetical protein PSAB6_230153 [Paraburkholderia sabiae]